MSPTADDPDSTAVTLDRVYRFDPATGFPPDVASRVLGGQACLWTEFIETEEQAERMLMQRLQSVRQAGLLLAQPL